MQVQITQLQEGCAVYCQDLSLKVRVRIIQATSREWRLIPQTWQNAMWKPSEALGTQRNQAQAFVHAGAWLQSLQEMTGRAQEDDGRWNDPYARPIHGRDLVSQWPREK